MNPTLSANSHCTAAVLGTVGPLLDPSTPCSRIGEGVLPSSPFASRSLQSLRGTPSSLESSISKFQTSCASVVPIMSTLVIPPGGTVVDTFKRSWADVPIDKDNNNAIATTPFLEAAESLTTIFGTSLPASLFTPFSKPWIVL